MKPVICRFCCGNPDSSLVIQAVGKTQPQQASGLSVASKKNTLEHHVKKESTSCSRKSVSSDNDGKFPNFDLWSLLCLYVDFPFSCQISRTLRSHDPSGGTLLLWTRWGAGRRDELSMVGLSSGSVIWCFHHSLGSQVHFIPCFEEISGHVGKHPNTSTCLQPTK